jgi:uncharacterized protein
VKPVFADTVYWVALIHPNDEWRGPALTATSLLDDALLVTTDSILIEVLNFFAEHGDEARLRAVSAIEALLTNAQTEVVPQTHENFLAGLALYKHAPTKATASRTAYR